MPLPLVVEQKSLAKFLNDYYSIPHFQREYCWNPKRIWMLLDDIWKSFQQKSVVKPLGMIITFKQTMDDDGKCGQIVDGQQRVITLLIFIRALLIWIGVREHERPPGLGLLERVMKDIDLESGKEKARLSMYSKSDDAWMSKYIFGTAGSVSHTAILCAAHSHVSARIAPIQRCLKTALSFLASKFGRGVKGTPTEGKQLWELYNVQKDQDFTLESEGLRNSEQLGHFKDFLMLKVSVSHCKCTDFSVAIEQYCCINRTGLKLTASQQLKAYLFNLESQAANNTELSEGFATDWNNAEKSLADVAWAVSSNRSAEFEEFHNEQTEEPLGPYLQLIAEVTRTPSKGSEEFLRGDDQGRFEDIPASMDLTEYFMQVFVVEGLQSAGLPGCRRKLFKTNSTFPDDDATTMFFGQFFSGCDHHVQLYRSFIDLTDTSWGEGPFLGTTCPADSKFRVQNCVSLLKHLGHSGLDQNFVAPAWLFSWKYKLAGGTNSGCTSDEALKFFSALEILAAYINFVIPRVSDKGINRTSPRHYTPRSSAPKSESLTMTLPRVQRCYYRQLQKRIWTKSVAEVIEWMQLTYEEIILFGKRLDASHVFQSITQKVDVLDGVMELSKKQIRYALLKIESMDPK
ncbi:unnamed protein product [Polarella glacialis]|uniref:GmrSD restriction endonucleases N-terminal domain-containing protein n=1 Tax=Polarella glacialis TaxID=89957 RepID=A0A813EUL4_POLGL|nr:unnamed protein product [Polarella glacialis]CAE8721977.1 unnamed protein product [Polarella glacialis]